MAARRSPSWCASRRAWKIRSAWCSISSRIQAVIRRATCSVALAATLATSAIAETDPRRDDLLLVLGKALYPLQVMAYCWGEVARDETFRDIGARWHERNAGLLGDLEALEITPPVGDGERADLDRQALARITTTVQGRADPADYCRAVGRYIDAGYFDLDQRTDLREPLKRLLGGE